MTTYSGQKAARFAMGTDNNLERLVKGPQSHVGPRVDASAQNGDLAQSGPVVHVEYTLQRGGCTRTMDLGNGYKVTDVTDVNGHQKFITAPDGKVSVVQEASATPFERPAGMPAGANYLSVRVFPFGLQQVTSDVNGRVDSLYCFSDNRQLGREDYRGMAQRSPDLPSVVDRTFDPLAGTVTTAYKDKNGGLLEQTSVAANGQRQPLGTIVKLPPDVVLAEMSREKPQTRSIPRTRSPDIRGLA